MGEDKPAERRATMAAKVPEITALFWLVKIVTTGVGESASDYLAHVSVGLAAAVGLLGFVATMWWQLRSDRYRAVVYWSAVGMVAVFGTIAADGVHIALNLPYAVTTTLYAVALAVILTYWYRTERTLSIHSIDTRRREVLYWLTVLATFALGTAAGDLTAHSMKLGYLASAVLFTIVMVIPVVGWWRLRWNAVAAFWFAYVITRPLGASVADWLGKPHSKGRGLGYGDGVVTLVGLVVIVALVAYFAVTRNDIQPVNPTVRMRAQAPEPALTIDAGTGLSTAIGAERAP